MARTSTGVSAGTSETLSEASGAGDFACLETTFPLKAGHSVGQ